MFCFRAAALFLLFGITLGSYAPYYDLADAEQHFADFINKYERKYESFEEYRQRFDIFRRNLNKLNEWNAQYKHENGGYVITQFSDRERHRSSVDFSQMSNATRKHQVKKEYILNAPDKVDYRDQNFVTEVKNQGLCDAGFIFSAIGNIEGAYAKTTGKLVSLSEQQALDCSYFNCVNGGYPVNVMSSIIDSRGIMTEADYPYKAQRGTCKADPKKFKVRVRGDETFDTPDVETMKGALREYGSPLATFVFASDSMQHYVGSDVLNPADCKGRPADHSVLLVGYNADPASGKRPHWIIKNSWGTGLGDQGYFYLDFESHCFFGSVETAAAYAA